MSRDRQSISAEAHEVLKRYWGYDEFRPSQLDIITSVLQGYDTIGLLPTGGGKSITFQIPALMLDGLTIVITPLISLMKDQVDNLRAVGVKATYLHSGMTLRENRLAIDRCRLGKVKILYLSPEKLQSKSFLEEVSGFNLSLIVVDEAHCISQWGYDFRPSYLRINQLRKIFPALSILALTASATPAVVEDIKRELQFRANSQLFSRSFSRSNLSYIVRQCDQKEDMLIKVLTGVKGTGIVYVRSRKRTHELTEVLLAAGISADYYHAGLSPSDKEQKQNRWKDGTTRVIVATNAFGMGIDKPDVRVVVHHDLPSSLEEYYQEAGRAGRDGLPAYAVILTTPADKRTLKRRVTDSFPSKEYLRRVYELVGNYLNVAVGDGFGKTYEFHTDDFCATYNLRPAIARNALLILTQAGYIDYLDEITTRSRAMILMRRDDFYSLTLTPADEAVLNTLLRLYTGLFADYVHIDEGQIARQLNVTTESVYQSMLNLRNFKVLDYVPRRSTPYVVYTTSRELPRYLTIPKAVYEDRRKSMEQRVNAMTEFAFSTDHCRVNIMLRYFGERPTQPCGKCDVCRDQRKSAPTLDPSLPTPQESIRYLISQTQPHNLEYIIEQISHPRQLVVEALRTMIDNDEIIVNDDGTVRPKHA